MCGGQPQWTPQSILKGNGAERGLDSKDFGGMTNGHWLLCLEWHELGYCLNTQRWSAPNLLSSQCPSLTRVTQHITHHSDLWWITNDKAFVLRDSDSVSLGWGSVSKGLPGGFYLQPASLCTPCPNPPGADRDNKGMSQSHSLGWNAVSIQKSHITKVNIGPLDTQIPPSSSVNYLSQEVCHFHRAELKEGPVLTSRSWHSLASLVIPDSRFSLRACWIELSAHWLGSFPSWRKQPDYTHTELELGAGGGVTPLA